MSLLDVRDVTFRYNTQPDDEYAVRDLDLAVSEGEFVGVTGRSGAGKATLCRLLSGQIPHFYRGDFEGTVTVAGRPTADSSLGELSKRIGFVFENPHDQLTGATSTVLEEVTFGLETHGLTREEMRERARESLAAIGVEDLAERDPQQLSGGQCQRVAIASVLAMRPDVLVLLQPTAQLDPKGADDVFEVVADMNDRGYTVVMVSQDTGRLAPHLDRLLVMDDGRVVVDDDPEDALLAAAERDLPVVLPRAIEVGHRLREEGHVDPDEPVPVTEEGCLAELRRVVDDGADAVHATDGAGGTPAVSADDQVVLDDLHHTYPSGVEALRGVTFSLDDGCVCLIGQNGAGKSTLVKHLNGLLDPTEGRVVVRDREVSDHSVAELAHDVGLSFQNPDDQLFHRTVAEEVRYGPRNLDYDEEAVEAKADAAIERLGLSDEREENPYDIGEPWRKRIAVASVVAMDTPVVVLDEPTSGQDAPGRDRLGRAVDDLVAEGKLVIVVTHDMDFVAEHADRTVLLARGEVLADGDTRDVLGDPETLAESNVRPPALTRLGLELGVGPVLTTDELFAALPDQ